jgi:hypothetical protein
VLGAGFSFKYKGREYLLPPYHGSQGSVTWEHSKNDINVILLDLGATDIDYQWGVMD